MTVWLLTEDVFYESETVLGVYATREKAIRAGNRYLAKWRGTLGRLSASVPSVGGNTWSLGYHKERVR